MISIKGRFTFVNVKAPFFLWPAIVFTIKGEKFNNWRSFYAKEVPKMGINHPLFSNFIELLCLPVE